MIRTTYARILRSNVDPDPVARGALLLARRLCCQAMWRIPTACRGNHESPNKDRPTLDSLGSIPASSSCELAIPAHGGGVVATGDRPTDMTRARLASPRHGRPSTRAAHMIWARSLERTTAPTDPPDQQPDRAGAGVAAAFHSMCFNCCGVV